MNNSKVDYNTVLISNVIFQAYVTRKETGVLIPKLSVIGIVDQYEVRRDVTGKQWNPLIKQKEILYVPKWTLYESLYSLTF